MYWKMCAQLASERKARRTHGGIQRLAEYQPIHPFTSIPQEYSDEKRRIGHYASSLIENNKTVFFETGATVLQCVMAFADRIRNNNLINVTVFTNSLRNLEVLYPVCGVNVIGGRYRDESKDLNGYLSELALRELHFDYCFIEADAVSLTGGIMAKDIDTVRFNMELVNHSENYIVLTHSENFNKNSLLPITSVKNISKIISDTGVSDELYVDYLNIGVNLIRV